MGNLFSQGVPKGVPVATGVLPAADTSTKAAAITDTPAGTNLLDLCFVMDVTGSMGSYITAAKQNIEAISDRLAAAEGYDVRFGLIAYRDHPPQDQSFVTREFAFSADVGVMKQNLTTLSANGGGDGPEAVEAGLYSALEASWRETAMKVVVLIADAPPHGLGENGDGFPDGAPTGVDPLQVLDAMSAKGICVYAIGCQPALSRYRFATDFFIACAERTNGQAIALDSAQALADVIMGASMEEMDLAKLTDVIERQVINLRAEAPELPEDEYISRVTEELQAQGIATRQVKSKALQSHTSAFVSRATTLAEAKTSLSKACPAPSPSLSPSFHTSLGDGGYGGGGYGGALGAMKKGKNKKARASAPERFVADVAVCARSSSPELHMMMDSVKDVAYEPSSATFSSAAISSEQVSRMYARAKKKGMW